MAQKGEFSLLSHRLMGLLHAVNTPAESSTAVLKKPSWEEATEVLPEQLRNYQLKFFKLSKI